jgi:NodT family efflux transporter outer membrane factor (OMF) lipoprotein
MWKRTKNSCPWLFAVCGVLSCLNLIMGCAVGPDFVPPQPPAAPQFTQGQQPTVTVAADGQAQHFEQGAKIAAEWWRLFRSPPLDKVIKEAVAQNANLQAAQARLRQSQENLRAGYGVFFPQISGNFSPARQRFTTAQFGAGNAPGSIFNLFTTGVSVSYILDVFGGQRRTVEGLAAQVDYQNYTAQATYLTLLGNVVNATVAQAAYRAQIEATQQLIGFQREQLRITETQAQAQTVPYANVVSIQAQLAATEATLPPLKQNLDKTNHLLAALVGRTPAEWSAPQLDLKDFTLPRNLPITLPSELVRQRPDILAAEATLHAASANIGVATAAMFPSINLSASYGQTAVEIATLFGTAANIWSFGANLAQPLFTGGTLWHQRKAAIEAYQASDSAYRQVVVSAFQQVADSLRAVEHDSETLKAQTAALAAADQALQLVQANYKAGLVNYLQVLTADNQYQQARLGLIQAQAIRLQDSGALFVALGGGWWNCVPSMGNGNVAKTGSSKENEDNQHNHDTGSFHDLALP